MGFTDVLRKAFPFISVAASLGGPLGTMAANAVGSALGVGKVDSSKLSDVITSAMGNPEQLAALKKAEQDFQLQMTQLGYQHVEELEAIAERDRESARAREIATRDWYPKVLATLVVVLCFGGEAWYFMHGPPPSASPELIGRILGTLDSALILVLGYYFGSSSGSADKTRALADLAGRK